MQTIKGLVLGGFFLLSQTVPVWAASSTFTMSATIPDPPSGVSITVSSVNASSNAFSRQPEGTTALSFDPMTFNTANSIYLPDHYFALDFAITGGPGEPDVTVTYNEGANPNGSTNGFGHKSSVTFAQEASSGETLLTAHGPKKMLINLNGEHVAHTELAAGSYLRLYLGVCTGNTGTDPAGCQPFSNADAAGEYTGSLVVTSVVN